jgi:NAD(P)-dependent dehydrogenase (short-subunit alcohol dehydrogenase family)
MKAEMFESISNAPTVLVTGASEGIGYATARRFVDDGATVYLHAPDHHSGEEAMTRLVKDGAEPLRLHLVVADFTRLVEVADLCDMLILGLPKLDVLVNNAAIAGPERRTYTEDGNELTFQVNYLAAYLLTTKLAPKLASAHGRVINVSSVMHRGGNIGWTDLSRVRHYSPLAMYAQSKACAHDAHEVAGRGRWHGAHRTQRASRHVRDPDAARLRSLRAAGRRGRTHPGHAELAWISGSRRWLLRRSQARQGGGARGQRAGS